MAKGAGASFDTTGMDPEMKSTVEKEAKRKDVMNQVFSPFAKANDAIMKRMPASFQRMFKIRAERRKKIAESRAMAGKP